MANQICTKYARARLASMGLESICVLNFGKAIFEIKFDGIEPLIKVWSESGVWLWGVR